MARQVSFERLLGFALLIVVILRAVFVPITPDEAYTYLNFVQTGHIIPPLAKWDPNNHMLNSVLSVLADRIFGSSLVALRLTNLAFYALLLFWLDRLLSNIESKWVRRAGFVLIAAAPLILEFAALSRGYGISFALMIGHLYYLRNDQIYPGGRDIAWAWLTGVGMCLANLNLLPLFIATGLVLLVSRASLDIRRLVVWSVLWTAALALFIYIGTELRNAGQLYYGTDNIIDVTIGYTLSLLIGTDILWWAPLAFVPFILLAALRANWKRWPKDWSSIQRYTFILLALVAAAILQRIVLNTPWPQDRTAMHFFILYFICAVYAADALGGFYKRAMYAVAIVGFLGSVNEQLKMRSMIWEPYAVSMDAFRQAEDFILTSGKPPIISTTVSTPENWWYTCVLENRFIPIWSAGDDSLEYYDLKLIDGHYQRLDSSVLWSDNALKGGANLERPTNARRWVKSEVINLQGPGDGAEDIMIYTHKDSEPVICEVELILKLHERCSEVLLINSGHGDISDYQHLDLCYFSRISAFRGDGLVHFRKWLPGCDQGSERRMYIGAVGEDLPAFYGGTVTLYRMADDAPK